MKTHTHTGNEQDSLNQALLQKEGITHILNVTRHIQMPIQHLTYLRLPALDNGGQNLKQYFEMAYKFIGQCVVVLLFFGLCCYVLGCVVVWGLFFFIFLLLSPMFCRLG